MIVPGIEEFTSKLLVEGNDDQHVVWNICVKFDLPKTFGVKDCTGIDKLLSQISSYIKNRDQNLGILIDADANLQQRWSTLVSILTPLGYKLSNAPDPRGSIVYSDVYQTRVGIWLMPNNRVHGMLEDFAQIIIPAQDKLKPHADRIISEIEEAGVSEFSSLHRAKAFIHTWLSWQESPGTPIGQAITKSYLDHNHELCILFVDWLNRLFNPEIGME